MKFKTVSLSGIVAAIILPSVSLAQSDLNSNLLANYSFESGLASWDNSGNASIRTSDPNAYDGVAYLFGLSTPQFSVSQTVSLTSLGFDVGAIDSGQVNTIFGGFQAGWNGQPDFGQISISFLDFSSQEIGSQSLTGDYTSNKTWKEISGFSVVPFGTRSVEYRFTGTRNAGSNNDAYLDAAYLRVSAIPEPSTYFGIGGALAAILIFRKKRRRIS